MDVVVTPIGEISHNTHKFNGGEGMYTENVAKHHSPHVHIRYAGESAWLIGNLPVKVRNH